MKIVRGYIVDTPLLVQGHPELIAKVGDVVRLYLDQVADPALPVFIRATVEHPIVSKSNCTGTSYSFSYNEALLTGAITRLRHEDIVDVIVYSTQGRSVYESYLLTTDDVPPLSESAWTDTVLRGPIGPQGSSAYQVAVANGFVGDGAQWLASLTGPTGPSGTAVIISTTAPTDLTVGWQDPETGIISYYVGGGWVAQSADGSGSIAQFNIDGGTPGSVYGGIPSIDGGTP